MQNDLDNHNPHRCYGCFAPADKGKTCVQCGYDVRSPRSPIALPSGATLQDKYIVGRLLGVHGVTGFCYLAWDQDLQKAVAVKEYLPRGLAGRNLRTRIVTPHLEKESVFNTGINQFQKQARQLTHVEHANVVNVRNVFSQHDTMYVVCDFHRGSTLETYLEECGGKLEFEEAKSIVLNLLDGLSHAHRLNVTHQFINSRHIRYSRLGEYVLTSFGEHRALIESTDVVRDKQRFIDGEFTKKPDLVAMINLLGHLIGLDLDNESLDRDDMHATLMLLKLRITGTNVASPIASCRHLADALLRISKQTKQEDHSAFGHHEVTAKSKAWIGGIAVLTALIGIMPKLGFFEQPAASPIPTQTQFVQPVTEFSALHEQLDNGSVPVEVIVAAPSVEEVIAGELAAAAVEIETTASAEAPASIETLDAPQEAGIESAPIYDETAQKIDMLLAEGDKMFADLWLTKPEGNSAFDKYKAVLELEASNAQANSGLMKISGYFVDQAARSLKLGKLKSAAEYMNKADRVVSGTAAVAELRMALEEKQQLANEWRNKTKESKSLVEKAKSYIKKQQFSEPKSANALDALNRAIELDSQNRQARKMLKELSNRLSAEFSIAVLDKKLGDVKSLYAQAKRFKSLNAKMDTMRIHVNKLETAKKGSIPEVAKPIGIAQQVAIESQIKRYISKANRGQTVVSVLYENGNARTGAFGVTDNGEAVMPDFVSGNRFTFTWPDDAKATTLVFENENEDEYAFDWPIEISYSRFVRKNHKLVNGRKVVSLYINNHQSISRANNFLGTNDIKPKTLLDEQLTNALAHENIRDDLFLRGNMNGWDTSLPLSYQGGFRYTVNADLFEDYYEFKFADENWSSHSNFGAMFMGKTKGLASGGSSKNLRLTIPTGKQGEFRYAFFVIPVNKNKTYNIFRVERVGDYKPNY